MKIHDSGDGNFPAELSGTYTLHPELNTISMGVDGEGDTEYILSPTTEWLVTEVYDVEGVVGDIGITAFNDVTTAIATDIEVIRQAAILLYGTFQIITTHYKGNDLCDVYKGAESYAHVLRSVNSDYTPPLVSWKITDTVLAPWVLIEIYSIDWYYDNTNVATEFLTLTDMITTNDELEATTDYGIGISEEVLALSSGGDITKVIDIVANVELTNISDSQPISSEIVTPDMTGYTTPSGIVTTSYDYAGSDAWKMFDRDIGSDFQTTTTGWLMYEFSTQKLIHTYTMRTRALYISNAPTSWTFEGSNNGVDFDILDTVVGHTVIVDEDILFTVASPDLYTHYKLKINAVNGGTKCSIDESYWRTVSGDPDLLKTASPLFDGDIIIVVKDDDSVHDLDITALNLLTTPPSDDILIDTDTVPGDLSSIGDDSDLVNNTVTFYEDATKGLSWDNQPDAWGVRRELIIPTTGYDTFTITFSGEYDVPASGLGNITILDQDDTVLFTFTDSHGVATSGQSLTINGISIYSLQQIVELNRTEVVQLNGATSIKIGIGSYPGSPYTIRYIRDLVLNIIGDDYTGVDTTVITAGEVPTRVFKEPELTIIADTGSAALVKESSIYLINTTLTCTFNYVELYTISNSLQLSVALFQSDKLTYFYGKVYQEDISIPDQEIIYDASNIATEFIA